MCISLAVIIILQYLKCLCLYADFYRVALTCLVKLMLTDAPTPQRLDGISSFVSVGTTVHKNINYLWAKDNYLWPRDSVTEA